MTIHFYDTSALVKHYHCEPGRETVDELFAKKEKQHVISRLAVVEFYSAMAKKVRSGLPTTSEFQKIAKRFRGDVKMRAWSVIRVLVSDYLKAADQIASTALSKNLRTLDALQLAIAVRLKDTVDAVLFISADQTLCSIAAGEGLSIVNPDAP